MTGAEVCALTAQQVATYNQRGWVTPEQFRVAPDVVQRIKDDHERFVHRYLGSHPEFADYCGAILNYDLAFLEYCRDPDAYGAEVNERPEGGYFGHANAVNSGGFGGSGGPFGGGGGFGDGANSLFPTGQKAPPGEEKQQQLSFVAGSDESAEANSAAEMRANKQKMMEAKGGDE